MNTTAADAAVFAEKIAEADAKLESLEKEIAEIGQPAGNSLRNRLEALKIEENALKRNFEESQALDTPDPGRMEKIETLLHHIEREEASLEHEADFLHQAAPSSVTLAAEAGARMMDSLGKGLKRVLRGHHPLGSSVFVNRTYETLVTRYGLRRDEEQPPAKKDAPK